MSFSLVLLVLISFSISSTVYVYFFRGDARFSSAVEYLRKGWPVFAPLNVILYLSTKRWARKPFLSTDSFENLSLLESNWKDIAQEAMALHEAGYFEQTTDKKNKSFYDVGFRTFYKYGWSKFYCSWYGTTLNSAAVHCPKTIDLLKRIPSINGALFTLLPASSQLTRHLDPIACSFRYHLGLETPNSEQCFINVDGQSKSWYNSKAFVFDETYLHYVENNTKEMRLILMCDLERPMGLVGKVFNWYYKKLVGLMLVPNLPGDQAGPINKLFGSVSPFLASTKQLKKKKPALYYPLKWTFNLTLLFVSFFSIYVLLSMFSYAIS